MFQLSTMEGDILDERSREFLETADQYITEHGHQHVSEEKNKQLVGEQHNLPEEFRIGLLFLFILKLLSLNVIYFKMKVENCLIILLDIIIRVICYQVMDQQRLLKMTID